MSEYKQILEFMQQLSFSLSNLQKQFQQHLEWHIVELKQPKSENVSPQSVEDLRTLVYRLQQQVSELTFKDRNCE